MTAQLLLTGIGGFAGFAVGGPIGFSVGAVAGSLAGAYLFPPEGQTVEGSRVRELKVTSSALDRPVPRIYGTFPLGTNLIWATDLKEVRNEEEVGGKLPSPSVTSVTFSYFSDAAFGVCEGVAQILTILADGPKKIYDATETSGPKWRPKFADTIRIYDGSDTQEPDPAIQADKTVERTPAYRGLCYFVVDDFPLADFGNRLPQFEVIVTTNASPFFPKLTLT